MNEPPATSEWQRFARLVRRGLAGMRASQAATSTVQEYVRVIPVLAGQVREAASHIEHTVLDITSGFTSLVGRARRAGSSARAAAATSLEDGDVVQLTADSRHALQRLHDRGLAHARGSREAAARIEDAIGALKIIAMHAGPSTPVSDGIRSLIAELDASLTVAMTDLRQCEADTESLPRDSITVVRTIDLLGLHHAEMRRELDASARETEEIADEVSRAVAVLQFQDRVDQRLQHVIDTLSEMQDEFVDALERPEERTERPGSAALRLRQRYTAAEARR